MANYRRGSPRSFTTTRLFSGGAAICTGSHFPNRHIGFGAGIHRCIGSFLARMMFEVMIETVFDRLPDYKVQIGEAEPYPSISPINGWVKIPARFTPGPRLTPRDPAWMR